MPVADGKQILEMIRAEDEFADIPVMFLTSKKLKEGLGAKDLHPEGYLLKSMEPQKIVNAIDEFFSKLR
jgi:CheY-like chemotaxis protein